MTEEKSLVHQFEQISQKKEPQGVKESSYYNRSVGFSILSELKINNIYLIIGALLIIFLGIFTGYWLSSKSLGTGIKISIGEKRPKIVGSKDTKIFKDSALGVIEKGGIDGEGTHKLIREGGPSQTVYLTSSVLNLDDYVGKKVKVWGETFAAQKAGWLMDVGRVEILE